MSEIYAMGSYFVKGKKLLGANCHEVVDSDRPMRMAKGRPYKTAPRDRPHYIYAWRMARRMSQEDVAERVGTRAGTISLIETGTRDPSLVMLRDIAQALGVEPGWLLSRDPTDAADVWAIAEEVRALPPEHRERAVEMVRMLAGMVCPRPTT